MIKVSVIVPVYNVEKYLRKCLDSLVNQTLENYEVIVVNDGSPDHSDEIIKEYEEKYPTKIKGYQKENGGLSDARNYGLKYAKGEYISFVDSDDYIKEDMLEKMYKKAITHDFDIILCDTIIKTEQTEYVLKSNLNYSVDDVRNYIISYPMACIRMVKREVMQQFAFRRGTLYEDLDLTPSYILKTKKVGFLDYAGYYYVQRRGSIMKQTKFNEKLLDIFTVLETNENNLGKEYPDEVEYLYISHLLRTATLRFLEYDNTKGYLNKIVTIMKEKYPHWNKNLYYEQSSFKLKLICNLAYYKQFWLLKIIKKITHN